jgi:GntR family transcriptional repressor for pyruvate dehydrogenase complex
MFKPIKAQKNYEEIIKQVKKLIIDGNLHPGDKLPSERELAERLEVSRTSVREAFSALEMMGIININPGEGSFVKQASYDVMFAQMSFLMRVNAEGDLTNLLEARKLLEVEITALAAAKATYSDLDFIKKALADIDAEIKSGGIGNVQDFSFHMAIAKAANNPILFLLMNTISNILANDLKNLSEKLFSIKNMPALLNDAHRKIYEAIEKKDSLLARERMTEHLDFVEKSLLLIKRGDLKKVTDEINHALK